MVRLTPLSRDEYDSFFSYVLEQYASRISASGLCSLEEARQVGRTEQQALLPQGVKTPGHCIYAVREHFGAETCGYLWFGEMYSKEGRRYAYLFSIDLFPAYRGRDLGFHVMSLMEEMVLEQGLSEIQLSLFTLDKKARRLYEKAGYRILREIRLKDTPIGFRLFKRI